MTSSSIVMINAEKMGELINIGFENSVFSNYNFTLQFHKSGLVNISPFCVNTNTSKLIKKLISGGVLESLYCYQNGSDICDLPDSAPDLNNLYIKKNLLGDGNYWVHVSLLVYVFFDLGKEFVHIYSSINRYIDKCYDIFNEFVNNNEFNTKSKKTYGRYQN